MRRFLAPGPSVSTLMRSWEVVGQSVFDSLKNSSDSR